MKKELVTFLLLVSLISLASAQVIIEKQPEKIYNLGESVQVPATIKSLTDVSEVFEMNLVCGGKNINFYKNGIDLDYGEQIKIQPAPSLVLTKNIIGEISGKCKIEATLGDESILTNEFTISKKIKVEIKTEVEEINPGESILIEGEAIGESGKSIEGFVDIKISFGDFSITQQTAVGDSYFSSNVSIPEDLKAGKYTIQVDAYEKNSQDAKTNQGSATKKLTINQVPNNLEIVFDKNPVEPGNDLKVKAILHDQTGEKIGSSVVLKIQNSKGQVIVQEEVATDDFFEMPINYDEPPDQFVVLATSDNLEAKAKYNISEKIDVKIDLVNKTLIVENVGNVEYCNKTIFIKISNQTIQIDDCFEVHEEKRYKVSAPDGEYDVEIIEDGKSMIKQGVSLTGGAIGVKRQASGVLSVIQYPFVWFFIMGVLGFVAFMVFRKGYKRSFIGRKLPTLRRKKKKQEEKILEKVPEGVAEVSLSIKGQEQKASGVCLDLKNFTKAHEEPMKETVDMIHAIAKSYKASFYRNDNNLIFVFAPVNTRTFANEKSALEMARKILGLLGKYNKLFKEKIDFGISINSGKIIAKKEGSQLKFMSLGSFMTNLKRSASSAKDEIILTEEVVKALGSEIKTTKLTKGNLVLHKLIQVKNTEEHKKFLDGFLKGLEKDKKK